MTRDDAIEQLKLAGFVAWKRDWALGETIAAATSVSEEGETRRLHNLIYLYPAADKWCIDDYSVIPPTTSYSSLEEVVEAAKQLLAQKRAIS